MSLIGKQIGNYQIKAKLGEGGMGAVYLGEHPLIGKRVAVKVLLEELAAKEDIVTRFFNEAKAVNDIGHQNIVDIVDFGKMKSDAGVDIVYFIMEFLDGESLAARVRRQGLTFNETLHIMTQCTSALAASHIKGIVHRDLKPENIYLCTRGNDKNFTKILDFGIAKLTGDGGTSSSKTRTGLVIGTPTYMSPEQCEGKGHIDSRSDVYSLGVVMYELLTGRVPFPGEGFGEILVAHLTKEPEPPSKLNPDISQELEAVVLHSIEKDRNRRFQTMEEFGNALADLGAHFASYKQLPGYTSPAATSNPGLGAPAAGAAGSRVTNVGSNTNAGSRPTTLSGSAAQLDQEPAKKSRAPIFVGLAVAAAAVVGIAVFATGKKPSAATVAAQPPPVAAPAPAPTPAPAAAPKDEHFKVTVLSDPTGANVVRAGKVLGTTPIDLDVKRTDPSFEVEVVKTGFVSQRRSIDTDKSREISIALKEESAAPVAKKSSGSAKVSRRKSDGKVKGDDSDMSLMQPKF